MKTIKTSINENDFFQLIGKLITSASIVKLFGEAVITNDNQTWIIFIENNLVIGFCCYETMKNKTFIKYLYVNEQYRGNGYGTKLINEVMTENTMLQAVTENTETNIFIKAGFKPIKQYKKWQKVEYDGTKILSVL